MRRPAAHRSWSGLLAGLAAGALVAGLLGVYAQRAVFSARGFSDRATAALRDPAVRDRLSTDVTDKLVLARNQNLLAARPLIQSAVNGFLGTPAFATVFRAAVVDAHRAVFNREQDTLTLTLRDIGTVAAAAIRVVDPKVAAKVDHHRDIAATRFDLGSVAARLAREGDRVRGLTVVLLALAALLAAAALLVSADRRRTVFQLGVAFAVGGVVVVAVLAVARTLVLHGIDADQRAAAGGVWEAFLGDLRVGAWVLAACGTVLAAAAASLVRPIDVRPALARLWGAVAQEPADRRLAALRAVVLVAAGVLVLTDRTAALQLLATVVGVALVYAGALAILRLAYDPALAEHRQAERAAEHARRHAQRGHGRRPLVAVATAGVLIVAAVSAFMATGGTEAPAGPVTACNGHASLCDRPLDRVALPATHNSMSAPLPGWFSAEQETGIGTQLADGIRGLLIDTYYGDRVARGRVRTATESVDDLRRQAEREGVHPAEIRAALRIRDRLGFTGKGKRGLYLCHGFCELGATPLAGALRELRDFLATHPEDVVAVINQDTVRPDDFVKAVRDAGLERYAYGGPLTARRPTLREMVDARRALLARVRACERRRRHVANLVAVNFYREGDLFDVVDRLNGVGRGA